MIDGSQMVRFRTQLGLCLGIENTIISLQECKGEDKTQIWKYNGAENLIINNNTGTCMDLHYTPYQNHNIVILAQCNSSRNQQKFQYDHKRRILRSQFLTDVHSGDFCLVMHEDSFLVDRCDLCDDNMQFSNVQVECAYSHGKTPATLPMRSYECDPEMPVCIGYSENTWGVCTEVN